MNGSSRESVDSTDLTDATNTISRQQDSAISESTSDSEDDTIVVEVPELEPTESESEDDQSGTISTDSHLTESGDMPPPPLARSDRNSRIRGLPPSRSSSRIRGEPAPNMALKASAQEAQEPKTIEEALARPDGDKWKVAIEEEMASLRKNHTWDLVDRPRNRNLVSCKWIFKVKSSSRYKARLVARGFSQEYGLDY